MIYVNEEQQQKVEEREAQSQKDPANARGEEGASTVPSLAVAGFGSLLLGCITLDTSREWGTHDYGGKLFWGNQFCISVHPERQ